MACKSCGTGTNEDGTPKGCGSKGSCGTSSCNKRSAYDWLADLGIDDPYANMLVLGRTALGRSSVHITRLRLHASSS